MIFFVNGLEDKCSVYTCHFVFKLQNTNYKIQLVAIYKLKIKIKQNNKTDFHSLVISEFTTCIFFLKILRWRVS